MTIVNITVVPVHALGHCGVVAEIRDAQTSELLELSGRKRDVVVDGVSAASRAKSEAHQICRVKNWQAV